MSEADAPGSPRVGPVLLVALVAGCGTMVVELGAVRLLAPWFGASLPVWTNVIGVILLALSVGYLLGARLAAGDAPLRAAARLLLVAAVWAALTPTATAWVCERFTVRDAPLAGSIELYHWGSLAAAFLLFLPPATLLGAVGPLVVEAIQRATGGHAGSAGGRVLAAATIGSLVGTWATPYLGIAVLGLSRTFLLAALLLAGSGWLARALERRRPIGPEILVVALVGGAALLPDLEPPEPSGGLRTLEVRESLYQWLRVAEEPESGMRFLQVNEGADSFQSVWLPGDAVLPGSYYYNDFALPPWWEGASGPWRTLVLGFGAGTAWHVLEDASPPGLASEMVGVEIDPAAVELGERWFDLPRGHPRLRLEVGRDARAALRDLAGPFDEIVVDAYANQVEIPPHLSTVEVFREMRERLRPGGWLVANVGGFGTDDPVVRAFASTLAAAFESEVQCLRVPRARNVTVVARRDAPLPDPLRVPEGMPEPLARTQRERAALEGHRARVLPGEGRVLTDDRNAIERLQVESLREAEGAVEGVLP